MRGKYRWHLRDGYRRRTEWRGDDPGRHSGQHSNTKSLGCSLTILLARNPDKSPGCGIDEALGRLRSVVVALVGLGGAL
jgi:hypothetical protein